MFARPGRTAIQLILVAATPVTWTKKLPPEAAIENVAVAKEASFQSIRSKPIIVAVPATFLTVNIILERL